MTTPIKLIALAAVAAGALVLNSCCGGCCTGVTPAEPLIPLPEFEPTKGPSK